MYNLEVKQKRLERNLDSVNCEFSSLSDSMKIQIAEIQSDMAVIDKNVRRNFERFSCIEERLKAHDKQFDGLENEVFTPLNNMKYKIIEVPITFVGRSKDEGKKLRLLDGFASLWTLIKYRLTE